MIRTRGTFLAAVVLALILHAATHSGVREAAASTQNFQLNQIESTLRSIESRLGRIESNSVSRDSFDPSASRLSRIESDLDSLARLGSDLARIEARLSSMTSADSELVQIDTRLAAIDANVRLLVDRVCGEPDDC